MSSVYTAKLKAAFRIGLRRAGDRILLFVAGPFFGFTFVFASTLLGVFLLANRFGGKTALQVVSGCSFLRVAVHLSSTAGNKGVLWVFLAGVAALLLSLA